MDGVEGGSVSAETTQVENIDTEESVETEELLVEEVSIDGLCGVY